MGCIELDCKLIVIDKTGDEDCDCWHLNALKKIKYNPQSLDLNILHLLSNLPKKQGYNLQL